MISTNQLKMYNDREKRDARKTEKKGTADYAQTTGIRIAHLPTYRMSVCVSTLIGGPACERARERACVYGTRARSRGTLQYNYYNPLVQ